MTGDDEVKFRADRERVRREMHDVQLKIAEARGRARGVVEAHGRDPVTVDMLRASAWLKHDPATPIRVTGPKGDERVTEVPEGWPPDVDPEAFVGDWIDERLRKVEEDFAVHSGEPEPEPAASPAVSEFRQKIGREQT